jgi:hypothetical protein
MSAKFGSRMGSCLFFGVDRRVLASHSADDSRNNPARGFFDCIYQTPHAAGTFVLIRCSREPLQVGVFDVRCPVVYFMVVWTVINNS